MYVKTLDAPCYVVVNVLFGAGSRTLIYPS
jgi:hypothetical protein